MEAAYSRLAIELHGRGYNVVPDGNSDITINAAICDYVRTALDKAEVSVHLIGEKRGAPDDDELDPLGKRQMDSRGSGRPEARAHRSWSFAGSSGYLRFWISRSTGLAAVERSTQVLGRFDSQIFTDKIDGDRFNKFLEFVFQYLAETAPRRASATTASGKFDVYLAYRPTCGVPLTPLTGDSSGSRG